MAGASTPGLKSIKSDRPHSIAAGSNIQDTTHSIDWNGVSVIVKDNNFFTAKLEEAILIKAANPGLNINSGVEVHGIW